MQYLLSEMLKYGFIRGDASGFVKVGDDLDFLKNTSGSPRSLLIAGRDEAGDGGEGVFTWVPGDHSALVAKDTLSGVWVAPDSASDGSDGAWRRVYEGPLNVKWFGAKGDGTTDDTSAVQVALNLGETTGEGISFPPSTTPYIVGPLAVKASMQAVSPLTAEIRRKTGTTGVWFDIVNDNVTIQNLVVNGDYVAHRGIEVDGVDNVKIQHNVFKHIGEYTCHFNDTNSLSFNDNSIEDGSNGISNLMPVDSVAALVSSDIEIIGNIIDNLPGTAIHLAGKQSAGDTNYWMTHPLSVGAVISDNIVQNVEGNGILAQALFVVVSDNLTESVGSESGRQAIVCQADFATVSGNVCDGGEGVGIDMGRCRYSTVTGNTVTGHSEIGIELQSCINTTCSGNTVMDCGFGLIGDQSAGITISDGYFGVSHVTKGVVVVANTVGSTGSGGEYGISAREGTEDYIITGNFLTDSGATAPIFVHSTSVGLIHSNHEFDKAVLYRGNDLTWLTSAGATGFTVKSTVDNPSYSVEVTGRNFGLDIKENGSLIAQIGGNNAVNYAVITASTTGEGVSYGAAGSDTNIPLTLSPKADYIQLDYASVGSAPGTSDAYIHVRDGSGTRFRVPLVYDPD